MTTPTTVLTPPKQCYVLMTGLGADRIGLIKPGDRHFRETSLPHPCYYTQETVNDLNEALGVSKAEAESMALCAAYGRWERYSRLAGGK